MLDNTILVAITADKGMPKSKLDQLSKQTSLPLLTPKTHADYLLHITTEYLELQKIAQKRQKAGGCVRQAQQNCASLRQAQDKLKFNRTTSDKKQSKKMNKTPKTESIYIDFVAGKTNHRRLHGGGKGQDISKAIGFHKIKNPTIIDLSAGMGGDAFVFATLGASVTMIERNPIIHALLNDALERADLIADSELQAIMNNITLIKDNAFDALDNLAKADVIYFDPMFPQRVKSAQVKKEMQFFHDIVGADDDSEALLLKALHFAKKRIVVKRPRLAKKLTEQVQPSFVISGKSTRYDIYLPIN